jgi:hypothetical protein
MNRKWPIKIWLSGEKQIGCWDFAVRHNANILKSYYYIANGLCPEYYKMVEWMEDKRKVKLFLDSGAFSAFTQKASIDILDYIKFIKEHEKYLEVYANLDVIGDAKGTFKNQKIMEEHGLRPMPAYHFGEPWKYLHYYVENYDYIAIGGVAQLGASPALSKWLDDCFNIICDQPSRLPRVKVHGFAVTSLRLMLRYPWYCMTEEHEVLTKEGWKKRDQLKNNEEILAFDDGVSRWEPITNIPTFNVIDEPIRYLNNRNFSAEITENHRWRVITRAKQWKWKTTDELSPNDHIPRVGKYDGPTKRKYPNWFVKLFAWYWTEAAIKKRKHRGYKKDSIVIYQSQSANPRKVSLIEKALIKSQEKYCKTVVNRKNGSVEVAFELYGHVRDMLFDLSPDKKVPLKFLMCLTRRQLQLFIKTSVLADGNKGTLKKDPNFQMHQKDFNSLEEFRIACLLAGYPTSMQNGYKIRNSTIGCVASSSVNYIYPYTLDKEIKPYTGKIWCVTVPSGAFFTRCNGKIYVTGNSVDSTSWVIIGRMGSVYVPKFRKGEYIYDEDCWKVSLSTRSPNKKEAGKHIDNFTPAVKKTILDYFEYKGYKLGRSEFKMESKDYTLKENERWNGKALPNGKREVEILLEPGLCNDYKQRDELNIIYFLDLEKRMPKWPWPFKARKEGLGLI